MSDGKRQHEMVGGIPSVERIPVYVTPASTVKGATAGVAGGIGIGALITAVIQKPELLSQIVGWGPALVIFGGLLWLAQSYGPAFIGSQQSMARNIGELAGAIQSNMSREDDVRAVVNTLVDKIDMVREQQADTQKSLELINRCVQELKGGGDGRA